MALNKKKKLLLYESQDLTSKLKPAFEDEEQINEDFVAQPIEDLSKLAISSNKSCSTCSVTFDSTDEQRAHFKLDWHRFNIANKLKGKEAITEEKFEEQLETLSLSGSESEAESGVLFLLKCVIGNLCVFAGTSGCD